MDGALPFISRNQLSFQENTAFAITIRSKSRKADTLHVIGATKENTFDFTFVTASNLSLQTATFNLPDVPIWVSVIDNDLHFSVGESYITVDLVLNGKNVQRLCSGSVWGAKAISWPNANIEPPLPISTGRIITLASADPAAGAELTITVPTGVIWKVKNIRFQLVTAAAAASRRVHLVFTQQTSGIIDCFSSVDQIISQTRNYSAMPLGTNLSLGDDNDIIIPIPANLLLGISDKITTETTALDAGDNFGIMQVTVEEFII